MWLHNQTRAGAPIRAFSGAVSLARFVAVLLLGAALARAEINVGDQFPELGSADLSLLSERKALPDLRGNVVLVDFWASWCAPCKASFPAMAKLNENYAARGFTIVAVSVDEKSAAAAGFWKKMNAPFSGAHDAGKKLVSKVGVPTMPTSYLIDRNGRVRFIHQGFHGDETIRDLRQQIDALLAEKSNS